MSNNEYTGVHDQCYEGWKGKRGDRRDSKKYGILIGASMKSNMDATASFIREHCKCSVRNGDQTNYDNQNE
jgi:hypothetical protein